MFNLFKKKDKNKENNEEAAEDINSKEQEKSEEDETNQEQKQSPENRTDDKGVSAPGLVKLSTDIDKLKAGQEAFQEVRKSFTERFSQVSERIGELRSMILDRDKNIQKIELKATKAADLVESVKPEKLMTSIQKQDVKIDALKANLEGNEAIMSRVMDELKEMRNKLKFISGVKEIIKLSEEVKKELVEIKKIEGRINSIYFICFCFYSPFYFFNFN
jgi:hypothetical protein